MARALSSQKVLHKLTGLFFLKDTATTTTVAAGDSAAKGEKEIDFTSATSFAVGDEIRIGANGDQAEICKIATIVSNAVTMELPFTRAIAEGEAVTKLEAVDLGATDEAGVSVSNTGGETAINAGTQPGTYLHIPDGEVVQGWSFKLRDFEKENIALALGIDEEDTDIVDANGIAVAIADICSASYKPWKIEGLQEDASAVTYYQFAGKVTAPQMTLEMAYGTATATQIDLRCVGGFSILFV